MGSRCSICASEKREDVDASLSLGWTQREVARKFGFSTSTVGRHYRADYEKPVVSYLGELKEQVAAIAADVARTEIVPELQRLHADLELAHLELAFARPAAGEGP